MKLIETKTFNRALKNIQEEIESRWVAYVLDKVKELNQENIVIKITKKKIIRAVNMSLNHPAFRLYLNNKPVGFYYFKAGWIKENEKK